MPVPCDILRATIKDLKALLQDGRTTSVDLVKAYLAAIENDNVKGRELRAVIETAPQESVLKIARELDEQRQSGQVLSPLHGIPILVKDNIATHPDLGMKTTAGSYALEDSVVKDDAEVIKRLRAKGAIIIGKTNMTQWANFRQDDGNVIEGHGNDWRFERREGWSARGGAGKSAFNTDRLPLGSSTGSAVGVSAGFAAAALGSETFGSIICPSDIAGLYAIKPTVGLVSTVGAIPISSTFDVIGPIAKSAYDAALLLQVISGPDYTHPDGQNYPHKDRVVDYVKMTENPTFNGKRVGFYPWLPEDEAAEAATAYKVQAFKESERILRTHGATVAPDVEAMPFDGELFWSRFNGVVLTTHFKEDIAAYLGSLQKTSVRSLEDIIKFNIEHKDLEMPPDQPGQANFLTAQATNGRDDPAYLEALEAVKRQSDQDGLGALFDKHQLDALVFTNADRTFFPILCAGPAKWPMATLPYGLDPSINEPVSFCVVARPWCEELLVEMMAAWEQVAPPRPVPSGFGSSANN